jgi:hypothetical protein
MDSDRSTWYGRYPYRQLPLRAERKGPEVEWNGRMEVECVKEREAVGTKSVRIRDLPYVTT